MAKIEYVLLLVTLICIFYLSVEVTHNFDSSVFDDSTICPSTYCGRIPTGNRSNVGAKCGACPRIHEAIESVCKKCDLDPSTYDYMYLIFMALLMPILCCIAIDRWSGLYGPYIIILYVSVLLETITAGVISILLFEPQWKFSLFVCRRKSLKDFYAIFSSRAEYNDEIIYCNYEIVYPRYTLILTYYAVNALLVLIFRPALLRLSNGNSKSTYAALFIAPILIIVHALLAGVIYYIYPYLLALLALVFNAIHLSSYPIQTWKRLAIDSFKKPRNLILIVAHSLLLAFSVCAITEMVDLKTQLPFLFISPLPFLFYIVSAPLTDLTD